ncbi:MAG: carbon storage regulator [Gemmataceae bacterium]
MLVLSRRQAETIVLPTVPATIKILAAHNGVTRLGIDAPPHVPILRAELTAAEPIGAAEKYPAAVGRDQFAHLLHMVERLRHTPEAADPAVARTLKRIQAELCALRPRFGIEADQRRCPCTEELEAAGI